MATCKVHYKPHQDITGVAAAALVGNRFVRVSAAKVDGEPLAVNYAAAGGAAYGITGLDIASGDAGLIVRPGVLCTIELGATVAALDALQVGTTGKAIKQASGVMVGQALEGGDSGDSILFWYYAAPDGASDAFDPEAFVADPVAPAALTSSQNATTTASDPTTTQALANALKTSYNAAQVDIAALRTAIVATDATVAAILDILVASNLMDAS